MCVRSRMDVHEWKTIMIFSLGWGSPSFFRRYMYLVQWGVLSSLIMKEGRYAKKGRLIGKSIHTFTFAEYEDYTYYITMVHMCDTRMQLLLFEMPFSANEKLEINMHT